MILLLYHCTKEKKPVECPLKKESTASSEPGRTQTACGLNLHTSMNCASSLLHLSLHRLPTQSCLRSHLNCNVKWSFLEGVSNGHDIGLCKSPEPFEMVFPHVIVFFSLLSFSQALASHLDQRIHMSEEKEEERKRKSKGRKGKKRKRNTSFTYGSHTQCYRSFSLLSLFRVKAKNG